MSHETSPVYALIRQKWNCNIRFFRILKRSKMNGYDNTISPSDRLLLEASNVPMIIVKDNGKIEYSNHAAESFFHYEHNQLKDCGIQNLISSALANLSRNRRSSFLRIFKRSNKRVENDLLAITKEGNMIPVDLGLGSLNKRRSKLKLITIIDATKRKQDETNFQLMHHRLLLATHAAKVGIWEWDIPENKLEWDETMYSLFRIEPGRFSGNYEAWSNSLHPDDKEEAERNVLLALKGKQDFDTEFRILWPDKSVRYLKGNGKIIRNLNGEPVKMIGTNWDVTEANERINEIRNMSVKLENSRNLLANYAQVLEKKVDERTIELQASQKKLIEQQKLNALIQIVSNLSHELHNPLNFVTNFTELNLELLNDLAPAMQQHPKAGLVHQITENMEVVLQHGKRIESVIKEMQHHFPSLTATLQITDINTLCRNASQKTFEAFKIKHPDFEGNIEFSFADEIHPFEIVPHELSRVITNLINNACYAIQPSGTTGRISVRTILSNRVVRIEVEDNGYGISKECAEKIFQPFFSTRPAGSGTGLGLSVSQNLIKARGGEITFESRQNAGSKFIIHLPYTKPS